MATLLYQYSFMNKYINKFQSNQLAKEMILYLLIGGSAVVIDALLFLFLYNVLDIAPVYSTIISITVATIYSFILNSRYNFKKEDQKVKRLVLFSFVSGVGMAVSSAIIYIAHEKLGVDANIAKILSLPVIAVLQFILNKLITFR